MNNTKRKLELTAAIISTIVCGLFCFIFAITFLAFDSMQEMIKEMVQDQIPEGMNYDAFIKMVKTIIGLVLVMSIVNLVFAILLLPSPIKNGVIRKRLGISITYLIITGIMGLFLITSDFIISLLIWVPFGLELASVCMKHPEPDNNEDYSNDFNSNSDELDL